VPRGSEGESAGLLARVLTLDLRSLAAFRVGLAGLIIADLMRRAMDFRAHYTDFGVLPRAALLDYYTSPGKWTIHLFTGGAPGQTALFVLHGLFALAMLVGFRTRLMTFLTFALTVSLHHRNPMVLQGGDAVVRMALFWAMFVPLGARFSVDEALDPDRPRPPSQLATIGTACLMIQVVMLYEFTGILKWHPVWHTELSGVRYALSLDAFATWFGHQLLSFPWLMKAASAATLFLELVGPVLALMTFWGGRVRLLAALGFIGFHLLLLEPAMRLGYFTWAGACLWLAWLPAIFWDTLNARVATPERMGLKFYYDSDCGFCRKTARILRSLLLAPDTYVAPGNIEPEIQEAIDREDSFVVVTKDGRHLYRVEALRELLGASPVVGWAARPLLGVGFIADATDWLYSRVARHRRMLSSLTARLRYRPSYVRHPNRNLRRLCTVFLVVTLAYVLMWNIRTTNFKRWRKHFPRKVNVYANVLGIEQYWNLFAPYPIKDDGWYVIPGLFKDGSVRDLYWDRAEIDWLKPPIGTPYYANQRWSKYMMNIWKKKFKKQRLNYGRWLCRVWNEGVPYKQRLQRLQIYFMRERTLKVGEQRPKAVRLWRHFCTKKPDKWEEYDDEAEAALTAAYGPPASEKKKKKDKKDRTEKQEEEKTEAGTEAETEAAAKEANQSVEVDAAGAEPEDERLDADGP
jgi:predicted DCC family thiol-disulfide oxidoreductase YuxK